ncbi:hypothetical protein IWX76_003541 [Pedobacter sp. CAN_A7]
MVRSVKLPTMYMKGILKQVYLIRNGLRVVSQMIYLSPIIDISIGKYFLVLFQSANARVYIL